MAPYGVVHQQDQSESTGIRAAERLMLVKVDEIDLRDGQFCYFRAILNKIWALSTTFFNTSKKLHFYFFWFVLKKLLHGPDIKAMAS